MTHTFGEYKGHKLIVLHEENSEKEYNRPFQFGKAKAKLIVENFEAIKDFAEEEKEE